jgi:hypothetical protein
MGRDDGTFSFWCTESSQKKCSKSKTILSLHGVVFAFLCLGCSGSLSDRPHSGASQVSLLPVTEWREWSRPHKPETDMTELNNEIGELSFDELAQVSGGTIMDIIANAYQAHQAALGKNLMDAIHPPAPKPTMSMHMR